MSKSRETDATNPNDKNRQLQVPSRPRPRLALSKAFTLAVGDVERQKIASTTPEDFNKASRSSANSLIPNTEEKSIEASKNTNFKFCETTVGKSYEKNVENDKQIKDVKRNDIEKEPNTGLISNKTDINKNRFRHQESHSNSNKNTTFHAEDSLDFQNVNERGKSWNSLNSRKIPNTSTVSDNSEKNAKQSNQLSNRNNNPQNFNYQSKSIHDSPTLDLNKSQKPKSNEECLQQEPDVGEDGWPVLDANNKVRAEDTWGDETKSDHSSSSTTKSINAPTAKNRHYIEDGKGDGSFQKARLNNNTICTTQSHSDQLSRTQFNEVRYRKSELKGSGTPKLDLKTDVHQGHNGGPKSYQRCASTPSNETSVKNEYTENESNWGSTNQEAEVKETGWPDVDKHNTIYTEDIWEDETASDQCSSLTSQSSNEIPIENINYHKDGKMGRPRRPRFQNDQQDRSKYQQDLYSKTPCSKGSDISYRRSSDAAKLDPKTDVHKGNNGGPKPYHHRSISTPSNSHNKTSVKKPYNEKESNWGSVDQEPEIEESGWPDIDKNRTYAEDAWGDEKSDHLNISLTSKSRNEMPTGSRSYHKDSPGRPSSQDDQHGMPKYRQDLSSKPSDSKVSDTSYHQKCETRSYHRSMSTPSANEVFKNNRSYQMGDRGDGSLGSERPNNQRGASMPHQNRSLASANMCNVSNTKLNSGINKRHDYIAEDKSCNMLKADESGWPHLDLDVNKCQVKNEGSWDSQPKHCQSYLSSSNASDDNSTFKPNTNCNKDSRGNRSDSSEKLRLNNKNNQLDASKPHQKQSSYFTNKSSDIQDDNINENPSILPKVEFNKSTAHFNSHSKPRRIEAKSLAGIQSFLKKSIGFNNKTDCRSANSSLLFQDSPSDKQNSPSSFNQSDRVSNSIKPLRENKNTHDASKNHDCLTENNTSESKRIDLHGSGINMLSEKNLLIHDKEVKDRSDERNTMSETPEVSTVVLENINAGNFEKYHIVSAAAKDSGEWVITRHFEDHEDSSTKREIDELPFVDPLQNFLGEECPTDVIPAPKPVTPFCSVDDSIASSGYFEGNQMTQSRGEKTELNWEESSASNGIFNENPDEKHIQDITSYLIQQEKDKSMPLEISKKVFKDIIKIVNYHANGWTVCLYGSYVSGLAVSTSNINFALKSDMPLKNSFLFQLQKALAKGLNGYQVEPFDEDKNPQNSKICLTEESTRIPVEIGFYGSRATSFIKMNKLLCSVGKFDLRIKTLLIAARIWAECCLIHEPEDGKLHTSCYSVMMLHFLQSIEKPLLPILNLDEKNLGLKEGKLEKNDSSVGELWLAFLKFYGGDEFNFDDNVVTIHREIAVSKSEKLWEGVPIAIEDPFTQKNMADSVVSSECAEYIFNLFKASYEYFFTSTDNEVSESSDESVTVSDTQSDCSKKDTFSFNEIPLDVCLPSACEICEELDGTCNKCKKQPRKEVILPPLPALSEVSLKCVNKVLHDVYNEYILPDSKIEGRKAFLRDLESSIQKMYSTAKLTMFGSSVNYFGFKRSDLDICMTLNHKPKSNPEKAAILKTIVRHLRKRPDLYDNAFGLYHAKIPIIKFHFIPEDWHCDLSLYNVLAVHNSTLLSKYALFDERCRILGCTMKFLAKKSCLDDTDCLSSYSYVLSVIHYLQQVKPPVLPVFPVEDKQVFEENLSVPKEVLDHNHWLTEGIDKLKKRCMPNPPNKSSVGELWLGLLDYYARYDNTNAVTITQKEPLPSTSLQRTARLLNLQDPFLETDNLGCVLSAPRADETRKMIGQARLLFGKEIPKDFQRSPKSYYFSSRNLTGRSIPEIECLGCGGFGHKISDCLKANPFKISQHKIPKTPKYAYKQKAS